MLYSFPLEPDFINKAINGKAVSIFLINGIRLEGKICTYDDEVIILESKGVDQLIYKHAIASIIPFTTARPEVSRYNVK